MKTLFIKQLILCIKILASWRMCVFVCFLLVLKYLKHMELYNLCFWGIISSSSYFRFVGIANVLHIKNEILVYEVAWRDVFLRIKF